MHTVDDVGNSVEEGVRVVASGVDTRSVVGGRTGALLLVPPLVPVQVELLQEHLRAVVALVLAFAAVHLLVYPLRGRGDEALAAVPRALVGSFT